LPAAGIIHGGKRETYDKRSAFAFAGAFRPYGSPVEPHKLLHDGETQTEAAVVSGERRVGLPETVKNVRQELRFDAQPGVSYRHFEMRSYALDNEFHSAALGREFDRIGKKVPDDLLKPVTVS
jgi:hypothetical protein